MPLPFKEPSYFQHTAPDMEPLKAEARTTTPSETVVAYNPNTGVLNTTSNMFGRIRRRKLEWYDRYSYDYEDSFSLVILFIPVGATLAFLSTVVMTTLEIPMDNALSIGTVIGIGALPLIVLGILYLLRHLKINTSLSFKQAHSRNIRKAEKAGLVYTQINTSVLERIQKLQSDNNLKKWRLHSFNIKTEEYPTLIQKSLQKLTRSRQELAVAYNTHPHTPEVEHFYETTLHKDFSEYLNLYLRLPKNRQNNRSTETVSCIQQIEKMITRINNSITELQNASLSQYQMFTSYLDNKPVR